MLPSAIRSKAILPGAAWRASRRDELVARAQRQNENGEFPDCLAASQFPSKPKMATPEPTVSPKSADDLGCAADGWGLLHDPAFAAGPARVVGPVPTHGW